MHTQESNGNGWMGPSTFEFNSHAHIVEFTKQKNNRVCDA